MATLGELKTRIRLETAKDDIASGGEAEQALTDAITEAINDYVDQPFWFNRKSGTAVTVASTATAALPSGMRFPHTVSYLQVPLTRIDLGAVEYLTDTGIPSYWAENEGAIQLSPVPNAVYSLSVQGLDSTTIPASDGATNHWTTEAVNLINHAAKRYLFANLWYDPDKAATAEAEELKALIRLRRETRRRSAFPLRPGAGVPWSNVSYNINKG